LTALCDYTQPERDIWRLPAGIAYCASPPDVSACLAFVRKFGLPVAARSGGHSYAGWSSTPGTTGLMVDVTAMNSFEVGSGQTVRVGTGLYLIDLCIERMRGVRGAAGGVGAIAFDAFGGALNRPSPSSTAFVHRNSLFLAQYSTSWNEGGRRPGRAASTTGCAPSTRQCGPGRAASVTRTTWTRT
jgi:hypothetical protein